MWENDDIKIYGTPTIKTDKEMLISWYTMRGTSIFKYCTRDKMKMESTVL